jgi:polar amino acid transport system substrate-binding protein
MKRRSLASAGWLVAAPLLTASCTLNSSVPAPVPAPTRSIGAPWPLEARDPAVRPSPGGVPVSDDCEPRASLRPLATLPQPGNMPAGTTMRSIADRGYLAVGTDQNNFLFGFRDPYTGQIVGFDVDIAREVAAAIFGNRDESHIKMVALASDERIEAIRSGRVDIVAETMTITCERLQKVAFSNVYYEAAQRILVPRSSTVTGLTDLSGRNVCATTGSTSIDTVLTLAPAAHVISAKYWTDCLVMLQQGQVEAITTDDTILAGLAAQDPTVHLVGEPFNAEPYGIAVRHSAPDLLRFVNGVLRQLAENGTYQKISSTWLGETTRPMPIPLYHD